MEVFWKHSLSRCCDMFSPKTIKTTAISESIPSYHLLSFAERELAAKRLRCLCAECRMWKQETWRGESPESVQCFSIDILSVFSGAEIQPSNIHRSTKTFTALVFGGQLGPCGTNLLTRDLTLNRRCSYSVKLPESASSSNEESFWSILISVCMQMNNITKVFEQLWW